MAEAVITLDTFSYVGFNAYQCNAVSTVSVCCACCLYNEPHSTALYRFFLKSNVTTILVAVVLTVPCSKPKRSNS